MYESKQNENVYRGENVVKIFLYGFSKYKNIIWYVEH